MGKLKEYANELHELCITTMEMSMNIVNALNENGIIEQLEKYKEDIKTFWDESCYLWNLKTEIKDVLSYYQINDLDELDDIVYLINVVDNEYIAIWRDCGYVVL